MNRAIIWAAVSVGLVGALGAAETNETPKAVAARNRAYVAKFVKSVGVVRYYTKKNADGEEFKSRVPYKCPNCGETHWRTGDESSEKNIPAEFAGFLIGPDRVLMQDVRVKPEFVSRIEVQIGDETIPASEFEVCLEQDALVLKTERPFAAAVPLTFSGLEPEKPQYFYLVRESGGSVAGIKSSNAPSFVYHVDCDKAICSGNPNTLVLNEQGEPVTVALQTDMELGDECFAAPSAWNFSPAASRFEFVEALEKGLRARILPLYLQLEAPGKESGDSSSYDVYYGSEDGGNERDGVCILMENGKILVPISLSSRETARLAKVEATLPDGSKAELAFVGSLADHEAFVATFKGEAKGVLPLKIDRRPASALFREYVYAVRILNRGGGRLDFKTERMRVSSFSRAKDNETLVELDIAGDRDYEKRNPFCCAVTGTGELLVVGISERKGNRWMGYGLSGRELARIVEAPKFDPENVPRASDDRQRTAWLGVEVQTAGADIVREKRAASYLGRYVSRAALVTEVVSNTPAAKLGLQEGDILLTARYPESTSTTELSMGYGGSMFDWSELFEREGFEEFGGMSGKTPWPDVEDDVNGRLSSAFGVGAEVIIAWVRNGVRMEGKTTLELAPVHYANAPKTRNKELGITVCDMTYEVRKYFKFDDQASGVVVKKVKGAGPASVAGIKPLELITLVNGEEVHSAKEFLAKTKGQKELTFSVRRLNTTRMVPIKIQEEKK